MKPTNYCTVLASVAEALQWLFCFFYIEKYDWNLRCIRVFVTVQYYNPSHVTVVVNLIYAGEPYYNY